MKSLKILLFCLLPGIMHAQDFLIADQEPIFFNGTSEGLRTIWFSNDNSTLFGDQESISAWSIKNQKLLFQNRIHSRPNNSSSINEDGTIWVQGGSAYNNPDKPDIANMYSAITIGNPTTNEINTYELNNYSIKIITFIDSTNKVIATIVNNRTYLNSTVLFNLETKKIERTIAKSGSKKDGMISIAISPNSEFITIGYGGDKRRVEIYNFKTGRIIKSFSTDFEVNGLKLNNDILVVGGNKNITIIDLIEMSVFKKIETIASVFKLALSPNGKTIAVGSFSSGADLIDIESERVNHFTDGLTNCLAFSNDGTMLAIGQYVSFQLPQATSAEIWINEKNK